MAFVLQTQQALPEKQGILSLFVHDGGLRHVHLDGPGIPPTFLMAFPTLNPTDDGSAHVLEHLVLSGSERYPARELFSRLGERTLASYLNAFTAATFTAYPFVSPYPADFLTVLPVYLDAMFRPLLRKVDFDQEGFRVEFDAEGRLGFQGVVFNEMKGVFDDPFHHVYHGVWAHLYPDSALGRESGGDPLALAGLTPEAIRAFHQAHYHPARAWLFTAGDTTLIGPIHDALAPYMEACPPAPPLPALPRSPLRGCRRQKLPMPIEDQGWVWAMRVDEGLSAAQVQAWELIGQALLGQSNSPWQQALQQAGVGRPGPLTGSLRLGQEHWLLVQVEGLADAEEVVLTQALLEEVLDGVAAGSLLDVATARRQLEGRHRMTMDTGSAGAVHRFTEACEAALYGERVPQDLTSLLDPLVALQMDPEQGTTDRFRIQMRTWRDADQAWLTLAPDADFQLRRQQVEAAQVEAWSKRVQDPALHHAVRQAQADVEAWMAQPVDADSVPKTPLALIPAATRPTPPLLQPEAGWVHIDVPLRGVGALTLVAEIDHLRDEEALDVRLIWEDLLPMLGMGNLDWAAAMASRDAVTTTLRPSLESIVDGQGQTRLALMIEARGLEADASAIGAVLEQTVRHLRLDEVDRITYVLGVTDDEAHDEVHAHGDEWVQRRLLAGMTTQGAWLEASEGLSSLTHGHAWHQAALDDPQGTAARLAQTYAHALGTLSWTVVGTGSTAWAHVAEQLRHRLVADDLRVSHLPGSHPGRPPLHGRPEAVALLSSTAQSRHLAVGWRAPREDHSDAPRLTLLSKAMERPLFEHLRSRGGAYGAWARYDQGVFTLTTYRDPRFAGSLADLEAVRQQAHQPITADALSDAQRAVFQKMDKPQTGWNLAQRALRMAWQGRTDADRQRFRERLLQVQPDDLALAAQRWLSTPAVHRVAFVPARQREEAQRLGLFPEALPRQAWDCAQA